MSEVTKEDVELAYEVYLARLERFIVDRGWESDKHNLWRKKGSTGKDSGYLYTNEEAYIQERGE